MFRQCWLVAVLLMTVVLSESSRVSAADRFWSGGVFGGGEFTNPGSWHDAVPTNNTTSDTAVFLGFLSGPVNRTVNLSVERSVKGLFFPAPDAFGSPVNFTFTGSKLTLGQEGINIFSGAGTLQTINNAVGLATGTNQFWDIGPNHFSIPLTLRVNGPLSGSGHMYKGGTGILNLTASNTNTGVTGVVEGMLQLTGGGRLSDKSNVQIFVDGTLRMDGMTDAINGLSGYGFVDLTDSATLVVGNSINDSEGIGDYFGEIRGPGGKLIKRGPGTFRLGAPNSYTGGTRVESGVLVIDNTPGSATGSGNVEVFSEARLTGGGRISGLVTAHSGAVIAPGIIDTSHLAKDSLLNVGGLDLKLGATLEIELGGKYVGENTDTLATNAATIAGSLSVSLLPGFTPDYGDVFEILRAGSPIVGTFAGLPQGALVGNFAGTDIYIDYSGNGGRRVDLRAISPGDFDADGDVDGDDLIRWQNKYGETGLGYDEGDADGDGDADGRDFLIWQRQYTGPLPLTAEATAVPEPVGALLLLAGCVGIVALGRK